CMSFHTARVNRVGSTCCPPSRHVRFTSNSVQTWAPQRTVVKCQKRSSLRRSNFQRPTYSITSSVSVADGRKRTDSPILTQQNNLLASGRDCSENNKGRRPPYKDRPSHFDVL